jgi:hypothetical protein
VSSVLRLRFQLEVEVEDRRRRATVTDGASLHRITVTVILVCDRPGPHRGGNETPEEEEEDLFVFNESIEGPRAPAVKPGRDTQA